MRHQPTARERLWQTPRRPTRGGANMLAARGEHEKYHGVICGWCGCGLNAYMIRLGLSRRRGGAAFTATSELTHGQALEMSQARPRHSGEAQMMRMGRRENWERREKRGACKGRKREGGERRGSRRGGLTGGGPIGRRGVGGWGGGGRGGRESRAAGPRLTEGSHLPLQPWPGRGVAPAHWGRWHQAAAHFVVHLFGRLRARWGRGKAVQRPLPVIWRPVSVTACRYGLNIAGPAEFDAQRARADRAQQWDNKCSTLLRRLSWGTRARPLVLDLFSGAGGVS